MRLGPPPEADEEPGQFWKDFIRETAPIFRKPTIEQLAEFIAPTFAALCDGARYVDDRLREIFDELRAGSDRRGQRRRLSGGAGDPVGPGRASSRATRSSCRIRRSRPSSRDTRATSATGWDEFRAEYLTLDLRAARVVQSSSAASVVHRAAAGGRLHARVALTEPLPCIRRSSTTHAQRPLAPTWHRIDSCVRAVADEFAVPPELGDRGCARLPLARQSRLGRRRAHAAARRRARALTAPLHRLEGAAARPSFDLADNMWGAEFLPQPAILPLVDLVITHAGNNTTTESAPLRASR